MSMDRSRYHADGTPSHRQIRASAPHPIWLSSGFVPVCGRGQGLELLLRAMRGRPGRGGWLLSGVAGARARRGCIAGELSGVGGTVGGMTAQPAGPDGVGSDEVIPLGGVAGGVVAVAEYRRLRALELLASAQEREDAETAVALEEYREWSAAGRPGAISHEEARRLLLGGGR